MTDVISYSAIEGGDWQGNIVFKNRFLEELWCSAASTDEETDQSLLRLREWQQRLRDVLNGITEPEPWLETVALAYVHLRSQWMLLNGQLGINAERNHLDNRAVQQRNVLSALLGIFERHIDRAQVQGLQQLLSEGISRILTGTETPEDEADRELLEGRLRQLHQTVGILQREVNRFYKERDTLNEELGRSDIYDVVALVRGLENQLRRQRESPVPSLESDAFTTKVTTLQERNAALSATVETLNEERAQIAEVLGVPPTLLLATMTTLHQQHRQLTQEAIRRETEINRLQKAVGTSDIDQLLQLMHGQRETIDHLTQQLVGYERDRATLIQEFGTTDPLEITRRVSSAKTPPMTPIPPPQLEAAPATEDIDAMFAELDRVLNSLTGESPR